MLKKIEKLEKKLYEVLSWDRARLKRDILIIKRSSDPESENCRRRLSSIEKRIKNSITRKRKREEGLPKIKYDDRLPIVARRDEIIQTLKRSQVIIISGETGSGKTTQIPKFCLEAGRGIRGRIGCTQPRRIAATTVAKRIGEELGGSEGLVGFKIRFRENIARNSYIKIMTDGILLAETSSDRFLNEYDTIIVDEAHERSLNIDFSLGLLKTLLRKRKDLKLIITSATIDTEKFSKTFDNAPVIEVSGRTYPVESRFMPKDNGNADEAGYVEMAVKAVEDVQRESYFGDILIFMPTEQDIRETCEILEGRFGSAVIILPLFARLPAAAQARVFKKEDRRKIIVATNVAETSITIPGIKFVIDTGLARISKYSPRSRTTSLPISPVSRSSCDQRMGRCGRVENGVCIRLFADEDYQARPLFTPPEILRANLAEVILRMMVLRLGDMEKFPFIDRPDPRSIRDGYDVLVEIGAIRKQTAVSRKGSAGYNLTRKGRVMAAIPLDPRLSAMLIEAEKYNCLKEIAVIASALSLRDPRERPPEKEKEADLAHRTFVDNSSDFLTLLNIWNSYHSMMAKAKAKRGMRRFCKDNYLSFKRMREWIDIHRQVVEILDENGFTRRRKNIGQQASDDGKGFDERYQAIHKSILSGYLSNIAFKKEKNIFKATKGREVMIFPGSSLFNKAPDWIMAFEIVETSRLFARMACAIDSKWLEELGKPFCKSNYSNPRWERKRGEVVADEQVTLFGLIIVPRRPRSFGKIDPAGASDIFIRECLVGGDLRVNLGFMDFNKSEIAKIMEVEDRVRRRDILADPEEIFVFYRKRLPEIYDIRSLKKYIKDKGGDSFLRMREDDLIKKQPDSKELSQYPKKIDRFGHKLEFVYRFRPGMKKDGVTVKVPAAIASSIPDDFTDWIVPGLYREKVFTLIKGLPKPYRVKLVPIGKTSDIVVKEMPVWKGGLITALGKFIHERFGVDIPASAWPYDQLPDHLKMRISLTGPGGEEIAAGRGKMILKKKPGPLRKNNALKTIKEKWERSGITVWDFPDLPDSVDAKGHGTESLALYPGLEKKDSFVNLRLFQDPKQAKETHVKGVAALYWIRFSRDMKFLKKNLVLKGGPARQAKMLWPGHRLDKKIMERVTRDLFEKNIRTREVFLSHGDEVAPLIFHEGQAILGAVVPLVEACDRTSKIILELDLKNRYKPISSRLEKLMLELKNLVPENFPLIYDKERLRHIARYVEAIGIRAQRAVDDFEKDILKSKDPEKFEHKLQDMIKGLDENSSTEKREEIETYFWMIEEYKVSIFAQELGTAFPVSPKRLKNQVGKIMRIK